MSIGKAIIVRMHQEIVAQRLETNAKFDALIETQSTLVSLVQILCENAGPQAAAAAANILHSAPPVVEPPPPVPPSAMKFSVYQAMRSAGPGSTKNLKLMYCDWFEYDLAAGYDADKASPGPLGKQLRNFYTRHRQTVELLVRIHGQHPPPRPSNIQQATEWAGVTLKRFAEGAYNRAVMLLQPKHLPMSMAFLCGKTEDIRHQHRLPTGTPDDSPLIPNEKSSGRKRPRAEEETQVRNV